MAYEEKGNAFGIHEKKCFKVSKGQKLADFRYFFLFPVFAVYPVIIFMKNLCPIIPFVHAVLACYSDHRLLFIQ